MKKAISFLVTLTLIFTLSFSAASQDTSPFGHLAFLEGKWKGTGEGFGGNTSVIESSFTTVMNGTYMEVWNESVFAPTDKNPDGEHHIDRGFISYDRARKVLVFRQFHIEGFVNQYVLNDTLTDENKLVFDSEIIENFVPGGTARWVIERTGDEAIETAFYVGFPGKEQSCYGRNRLSRIP